MTHPIDELMKRMLDMGPEGWEELAKEAEAEVGGPDENLPENIEIEFSDGLVETAEYRDIVHGQQVMRNMFDKLIDGLDFDEDE